MRKKWFVLAVLLTFTWMVRVQADVEGLSLTQEVGVYSLVVTTTADVKGVGILDEYMVVVSAMKGVSVQGNRLVWELTVTPTAGGNPYGRLTLMVQGQDGKWTQSEYGMARTMLQIIPTTSTNQPATQTRSPVTPFSPVPNPAVTPIPAERFVHPYAPAWPYYGDTGYYGYYPQVMNAANSGAKAATLSMRLSTRSGPATEFSEPGSFLAAGDPVEVISYAMDRHNIVWCQVDFNVRGRKYRAYTGLKRIAGLADVSLVPREAPLDVACVVVYNVEGYFGPGTQYAKYSDLTLYAGFSVTLKAIEGDWAQVQYYEVNDGKEYRVWVPVASITP